MALCQRQIVQIIVKRSPFNKLQRALISHRMRHHAMDSSTTVNQDKLYRYMVNFNPMADRFMVK